MIADNGAGWPADQAGRQAPIPPRGHGIGLSVCARIVAMLGGRMRLYNVPFGRGAVLQVELPVQRLAAA
jgi:signal transduction histidine kinase